MTLVEAETLLTAAQSAYQAALTARSVTIGDRTVINHEIERLGLEVTRCQRRVNELSAIAAGASPYTIGTWR
jgi:hypothetical protein